MIHLLTREAGLRFFVLIPLIALVAVSDSGCSKEGLVR
jgi:hypothetical protein